MGSQTAQHDKNVYILGAGFSADAGIPLVEAFLQTARELHRNPSTSMGEELRSHYARLFEFRDRIRRTRDAVALSLENIEILFSLIETSVLAGAQEPGIRDSLKHVVADTIERSRRKPRVLRVGLDTSMGLPTIEQLRSTQEAASRNGNTHYFDLDEYELAVGIMIGAFDPSGTVNAFLSFNYDTVVEDALRQLGYSPDYCSTHLQWNGGEPEGLKANLLKLHGAINWADLHKKRPMVYRSYSDTGTAHTPILVPPTWNKADLHPVMTDIWSAAYKELKSATRICIVGYSMPPADAYFKYFVAAAIAENPGLYSASIVDIGPTTHAVKRFSEFFRPMVEYGKFDFLGSSRFPQASQGADGLLGFLLGKRFKQLGRGAAIVSVGIP